MKARAFLWGPCEGGLRTCVGIPREVKYLTESFFYVENSLYIYMEQTQQSSYNKYGET